jgi:hypothetical protein
MLYLCLAVQLSMFMSGIFHALRFGAFCDLHICLASMLLHQRFAGVSHS